MEVGTDCVLILSRIDEPPPTQDVRDCELFSTHQSDKSSCLEDALIRNESRCISESWQLVLQDVLVALMFPLSSASHQS
jgi:hypothetical protein